MENREFTDRIPDLETKEHEKEINNRLLQIQIAFADEQTADEAFFSSLEKYTPVGSLLEHTLRQAANNQRSEDMSPEVKGEYSRIEESINEIYTAKKAGWYEKTIDLIKSATAPKVEGGIEEQSSPDRRKKAGLLEYESYAYSRGEDLKPFGIHDIDSRIEIHLEELYKNPDKKFSWPSLKKSLQELAQTIVSNYPKTRAVMMRSWLVDSFTQRKVTKRLGIEIVERKPSLQEQSTWWQLIDQNGQINTNNLEYLKREGHLRFQVAIGFIPVETFLKKFLPRHEQPQDIVLKKIDPEIWNELDELQKENKKLRNKWSELAPSDIDNLYSTPFLHDFFETEIGQQMKAFLKECIKKYPSGEQAFAKEEEKFKKYREAFREYMQKKKYVSETITIPAAKIN